MSSVILASVSHAEFIQGTHSFVRVGLPKKIHLLDVVQISQHVGDHVKKSCRAIIGVNLGVT